MVHHGLPGSPLILVARPGGYWTSGPGEGTPRPLEGLASPFCAEKWAPFSYEKWEMDGTWHVNLSKSSQIWMIFYVFFLVVCNCVYIFRGFVDSFIVVSWCFSAKAQNGLSKKGHGLLHLKIHSKDGGWFSIQLLIYDDIWSIHPSNLI
jgi:hypothetical protein